MLFKAFLYTFKQAIKINMCAFKQPIEIDRSLVEVSSAKSFIASH